MVKVLLCSITTAKLRVKYVPKQVQGREQEQGGKEGVIADEGSETIVFSHIIVQ